MEMVQLLIDAGAGLQAWYSIHSTSCPHNQPTRVVLMHRASTGIAKSLELRKNIDSGYIHRINSAITQCVGRGEEFSCSH